MSRYDECPLCGEPKRATSTICAICHQAAIARPPREPNDAWIEAIVQGIAHEREERGGGTFDVTFPLPLPLSEAQERLVRALGATPVRTLDPPQD